MLQTKLPRLSVSQSKRLRRKLRSIIDQIRVPQLRTGLVAQILPIFLLFLFLLITYNLFTIKKIDCLYDRNSCSIEITDKFQKYLGTNVLFLNQKQVSQVVKSAHPVEKISFAFKMFNTLKVTLEGGNPPVIAQIYLVKELPQMTLDSAPGSSESADWPRPTIEITAFTQTASSSSYSLWDNGLMTPSATGEGKIKYIFSEKPDNQTIKAVYNLIKLVNKYLNTESIHIVGQRVFLSQANEPDIIISVPFDERQLSESLQSFAYFTTLKKDAKVIDLRFKNPIIR